MIPRLLLGVAVAAVAWSATPSTAFAQFQVCNKTSNDQISVAVGLYLSGKGWELQGWYAIDKGQCTTLVDPMGDRYYYLYVESGDIAWDGMGDEGSSNFCIHPQDAFNLDVADFASKGGDNPNCEKRGYVTKRFLRVDTEKYSDYTFNIND